MSAQASTPDATWNDAGGARTVLDAGEIARALTRIAHEILERNKGADDVVLLGIPTRGVSLARRLGRADRRDRGSARPGRARSTSRCTATTCAAPGPRPGAHRHPGRRRRRRASSCSSTTSCSPAAPSAPRSTRSTTSGRPRAVQLAVLVDRGHRELPIRADYVGKNLPDLADQRAGAAYRAGAEHDGAGRRRCIERRPDDGGAGREAPPALRRRPDPRRRAARPRHRRGARAARRPADARSCPRCAAAPWSTCSSRTRPAPGSRSRPRPSGCPPTSSTSPPRAPACPRARA